MKTMYTARATADDAGRNGHAATDDGNLAVDLSMPEAMGGPGGGGTNPEQLFAVGYAACFANALRSAARKLRREDAADGATVTAEVDIGRIDGGRFGLAVRLDATIPAVNQADAEELMALAHERCPYSNATRGNIDVELAVRGGAE
ncbi:MAG: organic hydroperoxide resistance protein [Solirubrobacterales bacterium]|jgi:osmotically inducible protein OsmC|nr:organic hydroperoxide resistance protein [Solirubrobacterales bacterium]